MERCGIRDYVLALKLSLEQIAIVHYASYEAAISEKKLLQCSAVLLHYESSYFSDKKLLKRLNKRFKNNLYVVPHEVHREDPFAFPYSQLTGRFWIDLKLRQVLYKFRHRAFSEEKKLQRAGYYANGVIPLSNHNYQVLLEAGCGNLRELVPLAYFEKSPANSGNKESACQKLKLGNIQSSGITGGIFGFISASNDYQPVFSALNRMRKKPLLLISGGEKDITGQADRLLSEISTMGLQDNIRLTGFLPEASLPDFFSVCDFFICPLRFRSNTSSVLRLISQGKPVITSKIEITSELKDMGAPIVCYKDSGELLDILERTVSDALPALDNNYPYDFSRVARMYLERMLPD